MRRIHRIWLLATVACAGGLPTVAAAQDAGSSTAPQSSSSVPPSDSDQADIVVTAQKRAQRLIDVPMSIGALSGEDLERRSAVGMEDYLRALPGVGQIDRGGADNVIVIRGISVTPESENAGSGATVGTYFGEAAITGAAGVNAGGIDLRPVDLERVELLRGPQGTTFGSGSLGGTLRLIPAAPDTSRVSGQIAGNLSVTQRDGGTNSMVQGVINLPLVTDRLAVRAVAYRFNESGYYRNIASFDPATLATAQTYSTDVANRTRALPVNDIGAMKTVGGRVALLWRPTDNLDVTLTALEQKIEQDGRPYATTGAYDQISFPASPVVPVRNQPGEAADTRLRLANAVINYDVGPAIVTVTGSRVAGDSAWTLDVTKTLSLPATNRSISEFDSKSLEARIASKDRGRFHYLLGAYYEDIATSLVQNIGPFDPPAPNRYGTNPISLFARNLKTDQKAVFGELGYEVIDGLTATVGGRYFDYNKRETVLREGGLYSTPFGRGVPTNLRTNENGTNLSANVTYKPSRNATLYGSFRQGFRLGRPTAGPPLSCDANNDGIIDGSNITVAATQNIRSDNLDQYEVGAKFSLLGGRLTADASAFRINWKGLPVTIRAGTCLTAVEANVGGAISEGGELQLNFRPANGLTFALGGSYTDARLSEATPTVGAQVGDRLPGSPRWNANASAQYEFPLAGARAFARVDSIYVGPFYGNLQETPDSRAGDYVKVDMRAGVTIENLSAELFVRNLTNEDATTYRNPSAGRIVSYSLRPRTIGMQVGYRF